MKKRPQRARKTPAHVQRHKVGYRKPPVETQFKPGQSGNPNGRPKGSRSSAKRSHATDSKLASLILAEANREVKINSGGRTETLTSRDCSCSVDRT